MRAVRRVATLGIATAMATALLGLTTGTASAAATVPRYDHVVVVIMENHSSDNIIANAAAPYINALAAGGASMTQSYGVTHPSQPNYLALFSGSQQGVVDDSCLGTFTSDNLGAQLIAAGQTFVGYSESMPSVGYTGCATSAGYARKHNPWVDFSNVPVASNQPLTSLPSDWSALPTVSMVVPNLQNDMHDGTITQADTWLHDKFDGYLQWATTHNSLLVLTWDEDDNHAGNRIPTIFAGPGVRSGQYPVQINHYNVLRTLQDMYGLPPLANTATAGVIVGIWSSSPVNQPPVAAFTGSCIQLVCTVDASTSSDPDGTVAGYTWDWGDGATTSGVAASHTFATGGAKTVTLMVTDNLGRTASTSSVLTSTGPPGQPFAADAFARTRLTGWGAADIGGSWAVSASANSSVAGGTGKLTVKASQTNTALLPLVISSDTDLQVTLAVDKLATGNGVYLGIIGRHTPGNLDYKVQAMLRADGRLSLQLLGGSLAQPAVIIPGISIASSAPVKVRLQVTGTSPTTLRGKAWQATGTEPTAWQVSGTDAGAGLQVPGAVGLSPYLSSGSIVTPVTVQFSGFSARPTNQSPVAAFTGSCAVLTCAADATGSTDPDGSIAGYAWNWVDGATSTGATPTHSYPAAGSYPVTLTVTDNLGVVTAVSHVLAPTAPVNVPPTAAVTVSCVVLACSADSAGSTDPDGVVAGYAWSWGDGTRSTGATAQHTYATAGTYTVSLIVTDNLGGPGTTNKDVTVTTPPTEPPVADFTASCTLLACYVDAAASTDPDGTIAAYSWTWGDGATSTGSVSSHSCLTPGAYTVTLTVTDDKGAIGATTRAVTATLPPNQPPTAVAAGSCTALACSVTSTGSADPDGSIQAYAWNWGDGTAAGTGATGSHVYSAAGQQTVTLTVTDNQGATGTTQISLNPTAPGNLPFAADAFARTSASGWGTADVGGAWTVGGSATRYTISPGAASMAVAVGQTLSAALAAVSSSDADIRMTLSTDKLANGNGVYVTVVGRRIGTNLEYRARLRFRADGTVAIGLGALTGTTTEVVLRPDVVPSGVSVAGGGSIATRVQVTGTSPTTVRMKVWNAGGTEPAAWQLTATDATTALQKAGSFALTDYLSSASTVTPVTLRVADFSARPVTAN